MKNLIMMYCLCSFFSNPETLAQNLDSSQKYIVFYSRPPRIIPFSVGGHAFVSWVEMRGSQMVGELTYGFYPKGSNAVKTVVLETEGEVVSGFEKNLSGDLRLEAYEIRVSDSIFRRTRAAAIKMNRTSYRLFSKNCVALMHCTALSVGMKTPSTKRLILFPKSPIRYLRQLKRKNTASIQKKKLF